MSFRGGRGGSAGGAGGGTAASGGPRLSTGSSGNSFSGSPANRNRNSQPPVRGWGSAAPQTNGVSSQRQNVPGSSSAAATASAFPSLAGAKASSAAKDTPADKMKDRVLFVLVSLIGNTVKIKTKAGNQYVGVLQSTSDQAHDLGVTLSTAQEILPDGALGPPHRLLVVKGPDLESIDAHEITVGEPVSEAAPARSGFRTDVEISARDDDPLGQGRFLQKWDDGGLALDGNLQSSGQPGDGGLSGASKSGAWDQFAANEARFGLKSNYDEDIYTTKLDRSGQDFKEQEKKAERIAAEIMGQATTNTHMAEERNQVDDSGQNEEDKYGAVVRGPGAYVPPGARKAAAGAATAAPTSNGAKPQPSAPTPTSTSTATLDPSSKAPEQDGSTPSIAVKVPTPTRGSPLPSGQVASDKNIAPSSLADKSTPSLADKRNAVRDDFKEFVNSEWRRAEAKKADQKAKKLAEFKQWSSTFTLKTNMPEEVASMLGKSPQPKDATLAKSLSPLPAHAGQAGPPHTAAQTKASGPGTLSAVASPSGGSGSAPAVKTGAESGKLADVRAALAKMTIPKIPPYNPEKAKARQAAAAAASAAGEKGSAAPANADPAAAPAAQPATGAGSNFKMSAKASAFKPFNPAAASFTPSGAAPAVPAIAPGAPPSSTSNALPSTAAKPAEVSLPSEVPLNPFFGAQSPRKSAWNLHIREDFNPFKIGKVPEASSISLQWPYTGKSYKVMASQQVPSTASSYSAGQPPPAAGLPRAPGADDSTSSTASTLPATPATQHSIASAHGTPASQSSTFGTPLTSSSTPVGLPPMSGPPGGLNLMHAHQQQPGLQGQPFGMVFQGQPSGPYRFPPPGVGPGQYMMQGGVPMGGSAGPVPYGAMGPAGMMSPYATMGGVPHGMHPQQHPHQHQQQPLPMGQQPAQHFGGPQQHHPHHPQQHMGPVGGSGGVPFSPPMPQHGSMHGGMAPMQGGFSSPRMGHMMSSPVGGMAGAPFVPAGGQQRYSQHMSAGPGKQQGGGGGGGGRGGQQVQQNQHQPGANPPQQQTASSDASAAGVGSK